jgi:hypothetical protein
MASSLLAGAAPFVACAANDQPDAGKQPGGASSPGNAAGSSDDARGDGASGVGAPELVGGSGGPGAQRPRPADAPDLPEIESPDFTLDADALEAFEATRAQSSIGSELLCDGIDENENGIIDDVDVGRDGLCDCLRIGFLGTVASDAGNQTAAFEDWLEERSDIPVRHFDANAPLTADSFGDLQVLVVGNLSERANAGGYSPAEVEAVAAWVRDSGGGMITLAGYTAQEQHIVPTVQLLGPTGLSYDYQGRGPGVLGVGAPPVITRGVVAPDHPTMEGLVAMGIYNAYPVIGDGEVIVREGNFNLAMTTPFGEGLVFAFSDEWITQDSLWYPLDNLPLTPCQQQCNQCNQQCDQCDRQCDACQEQPCTGGQVNVDAATCARGCDQGCESCTRNCNACAAQCQVCSADELNDRLDIPRFWLNTLRWLTPENECKVPIPTATIF